MGRKSAKSKEKKMKRKEETAKMAVALKKVDAANAVEDPIAPFPVFRKYDRNGINVTLETKRVDDLDEDTVNWIFQLTSSNMKTLYEQSDWGWSDREKREELTDSRAWYLLARNLEGVPVAFSHFRFDLEEGDEVLYCYELQLEKSVRRKGLGKFMMQIMELMAHRYEMLKVMLTTFKHNLEAHNFFRTKLKYEVDEISPEASMYEEDYTYLILSKSIPQKSASTSTSTKSKTSPLKDSNTTSTKAVSE
ncbi:N-alpha-acetyltransferase 40-like [Babylonia areolata]|uniref:N-alpha-acetyltransferase 40-like n=1 Tax=Babylonia areolata TaxID=304850 RepID=UPI003FD48570